MMVGILFLTAITVIAGAYYDMPTGSDAAFLGLSTMCCIAFAIPAIIGLLIAIWVYKDAEKRGKSGILWLLIVWITFPIGLIIWLVVRPPIGGEKQASTAANERKCPSCGRPIPMDAQVCPYCGKDFRPPGQQ